ncbi:Phosphomannomutase/phosphoglucomutase [Salinivirga cyanobacteriivorans]|uniref:Phosphomannomutase/phosphoglucomutase n=1 Tax=Salinivirga cyanobacteriivorans TaxID=1307839 RepID=A0A0S2I495_9BACT|nr:phosphoglucosamine mutase [Salinivirga cyanobacteriivorans]ALO17074.1 Phosphomannomutase/phosphoglucomutase [Salinivirga cyanobacteriivorans]
MALIKSISGIRGTIGGRPGNNLTPVDIVKFVAAYGQWLKNQQEKNQYTVVVGRDARISGSMVKMLVNATLSGLGINVLDIDLASTPTTEMAVTHFNADGGLILTASHNPREWNALKMLNKKGEFLNAAEGEAILTIADENTIHYVDVDHLGTIQEARYHDEHIKAILDLELVHKDAIAAKNFKVVVDGINSVGSLIIPDLLRALGVKEIIELNSEANGQFAHPAEPLPENVVDICNTVKKHKADLGIVVDPDVDRLALIDEKGVMFGEEYTIVAVAEYVLHHNSGNAVSNLSSSRALRDITEQAGGNYFASAVGEVNVVATMKERNAVIGGEGNGGVIYPELHYGRDALIGIALFLSHLAKMNISVSKLKKRYPSYTIIKDKINLSSKLNLDRLLDEIARIYRNENVNRTDGVKIDLDNGWIHLRKSNTEPIIRIYCEAHTIKEAQQLANKIKQEINRSIAN